MGRKRSGNPAVLITIRIDKSLKDKFTEISKKTGKSRNKLINVALEYAMNNIRVKNNESGEN